MMSYMFMMGGKDAEMMAIRELLEGVGAEYVDHQLGWGAKVDSYKEEIEEALNVGKTPVCIELQGAEAAYGDQVIVVDHHFGYTDRPAAIMQVCKLLGVEPNRHQQLIAANDSGYIPGMLAMGATPEEVSEIRRLDRAAQGITPEQEAEAERALQVREHVDGVTVVRMEHSKCAPVTDALFDTDDAKSLLIICGDGERDYFGNGAICQRLIEAFPTGWAGGSGLGDAEGTAFFGCYDVTEEELLTVIAG